MLLFVNCHNCQLRAPLMFNTNITVPYKIVARALNSCNLQLPHGQILVCIIFCLHLETLQFFRSAAKSEFKFWITLEAACMRPLNWFGVEYEPTVLKECQHWRTKITGHGANTSTTKRAEVKNIFSPSYCWKWQKFGTFLAWITDST